MNHKTKSAKIQPANVESRRKTTGQKPSVKKLAPVFSARSLPNCEIYLDKNRRIYQGERTNIQEITLRESVGVFRRAYETADSVDFGAAFAEWLETVQSAIPETRTQWKIELSHKNAGILKAFEKSTGRDGDVLINECVRLHFAEKQKAKLKAA